MTKEEILGEMKTIVDVSMKENLPTIVGPEVAAQVEKAVDAIRLESALSGKEVTGLTADDKKAFANDMKSIVRGEKAAFLEGSDQAGGYVVPTELHSGIMRIAETTGLVVRDAQKFDMGTDTLDVPIYTGAAMQGAYVGENVEGSETQNDLGNAKLTAHQWMTLLRFSNALLADAGVNLADWFLGLAGEGLAYRLDREGFVGGTFAGSPSIGLLSTASNATVQTLGSGLTGFEDLTLEEASIAIGAVPTAALRDAAFYFNPTVWAKIRAQKSGDNYVFGQSNLAAYRRDNGIQAVGEILGYPVYTTSVLPAYTSSAISTKFGVFGSLKNALFVGDRGPIEIGRSTEATVGGVNLFAANQTALRMTHRHAVTHGLGAAAVVLKTAAA